MLAIAVRLISGYVLLQLCLTVQWKWCALAADDHDIDNNHVPLDCTYDAARGIKLCDCGWRSENYVLPEMIGQISQIHISNCHWIRIKARAFLKMIFVQRVNVLNIQHLSLDQYSLEFQEQFPTTKLQLHFENTTFHEIPSHAMRGFIDHIGFHNCMINNIRPFAMGFADPAAYAITINSTMIQNVDSQAFKNIAVERFDIMNSVVVADIPSRAFFDIDILDEFLVENSTFAKLQPNAFAANKIRRLILRNNSIGSVLGESLNIEIGESIRFQQNVFHHLSRRAFAGISVAQLYRTTHSERLDWVFKSNSINDQEHPYGLIFDKDFKLSLSDLNYKKTITCEDAEGFRNNYFLMHYANTIHYEFFMGDRDADTNERLTQPLSVSEILNDRCIRESHIFLSVLAVMSTLIILIIVAGYVLYRYIRARRKLRQLDIVAPEGKTYRETQIVFQVQNVGLLKTDL